MFGDKTLSGAPRAWKPDHEPRHLTLPKKTKKYVKKLSGVKV